MDSRERVDSQMDGILTACGWLLMTFAVTTAILIIARAGGMALS